MRIFSDTFIKKGQSAIVHMECYYPRILLMFRILIFPLARFIILPIVFFTIRKAILKLKLANKNVENSLDFYLIQAADANYFMAFISMEWFKRLMLPHYKFVYSTLKDELPITFLEFVEKANHNFLNPKYDLMHTIKELNHFLNLRIKRRKRFGLKPFYSNKRFRKYFSKYHKKVVDQMPDLNEFINMCGLDRRYNFCGLGTIKPGQDTVVKVG